MKGINWKGTSSYFYVADSSETPLGEITIWWVESGEYYAEAAHGDYSIYTGVKRATEAEAKADAQKWYNRRLKVAMKYATR